MVGIKKIGGSETNAKRIVRSLYGILSLYEYPSFKFNRKGKILYYYLPHKNYAPVQDALNNRGIFKGKIEQRDINILRAIYNRDKELKERYGKNWNPRFHETEIAKLSNKGKKSVRNSLDRLIGILAETNIQEIFELPSHDGDYSNDFIYIYKPRWFLPTARISTAKEIIRQ